MFTKLCRTTGLAAGAFCLLAAGVASADGHGMDAAAKFSKMHEAIAAAEACGGYSFSRADHSKMAAVIDQEINFALGAGERLSLIQSAKAKIRGETMTNSASQKNCDSDDVKNGLANFDTSLKSAL